MKLMFAKVVKHYQLKGYRKQSDQQEVSHPEVRI